MRKTSSSMRHSEAERERISETIIKDRVINNLENIDENSVAPNTNNNESDQPKPCFPCCLAYPDISDASHGFWSKRRKDFFLVRIKMKKLIENKWFDNGILVLILASSTVLVSLATFLQSIMTIKLCSYHDDPIKLLLCNRCPLSALRLKPIRVVLWGTSVQ